MRIRNEEQCYEILEINPRDYTWKDLKSTIKRKVANSHPDKGGNSELFINYYDAYFFLKAKGVFKNIKEEEKLKVDPQEISRKRRELDKEVIENIYKHVFSRYVFPEFDYFFDKLKNIGDYVSSLAERYKHLLFNESLLKDVYSLANSPTVLLKGDLFFHDLEMLGPSYTREMFGEILFKEPFNQELYENFVSLIDPKRSLVNVIPLKGNVEGGLDLAIIFSPPEKERRTSFKDSTSNNLFVKKFFNQFWNVGTVEADLRIGEYWQFKGVYGLKANPFEMDVRTSSSFFKLLLEGIQSKDYKLELSRIEIPTKHPNFEAYHNYSNRGRGGGYYIRNLKAKNVEIILEGEFQVENLLSH